MYKITSRWPHQHAIKIEWNLGKRCNLDCSYCPAEIHNNHSPHTDISILENAVNYLANLNKPLRVSLTGGEPCVHPKIEHLLAYMKPRVDWINVTTNITRTAKWYYSQWLVDHWVFSLHFEDNDWYNRIAKILEIYEFDSSIKIQINVMAHHDFMDRVKKAVKIFDQNKIPYVIRRIRWTEKHDWFDDMKYNSNDLDWILSKTATAKPNVIVNDNELYHANDIIKNHSNKFKGWKCFAGVESLMINWDGEVYRATCRVGNSLGNIYNNSFTKPIDSIICTREWCTCAADIPLSKERTHNE
jgi:MoaA/NifB/PqqE/SkfB family radical SAM enzyme